MENEKMTLSGQSLMAALNQASRIQPRSGGMLVEKWQEKGTVLDQMFKFCWSLSLWKCLRWKWRSI